MKPLALFATLLMLPHFTTAQDDWNPLPALPDAEGFAGSFAGVSQGVLLVAGGTNFPDKMPWDGGTKVWYDTVYALDKPEGAWRKAGQLPQPNGYGVSITTADGLVCAGGGNATEHFREVFLLRLGKDGHIKTTPLPSLPKPCAFMSGVELEGILYLAGGIETATATQAFNALWALDLKSPAQGWTTLPACPGKGRILATMAADDGKIYWMSGAALKAGADGKAEREWLNDAWTYEPAKGWNQIADLPRVAVAAPSPAPVIQGHLLILGGDDGANVNFEPKEKHPGFPREILTYHPGSNTWGSIGDLPFSLVTSPAVMWQGHVVVPGGEARPGKRSPEVWAGKPILP